MTGITALNVNHKLEELMLEHEELLERVEAIAKRIDAFRLVLDEFREDDEKPALDLSGLPLEDALVAFAERHNGELNTYQVRPALIDAGLLKGESRNISLQLYQTLSGSRRFQQAGPRGRYRLVSMQREDDHEPETAMEMGIT